MTTGRVVEILAAIIGLLGVLIGFALGEIGGGPSPTTTQATQGILFVVASVGFAYLVAKLAGR